MTAASEPAAGPAGAPARLVLVGRTGLDEPLRDAEFQLVRTRSGLDAIGALAGEGALAVVIGAGTGAEGPDETRQMIEAMRRVRPGVRIVTADGAVGAADAALHSARLDGLDPVKAIRRVIRGDAVDEAIPHDTVHDAPRGSAPPDAPGAPEAAPEPAPSPMPAPAPAPPAAPRSDRPTAAVDPGFADADLARELVRGVDILGLAMDVLRQRSGDPGLRFVAHEAGGHGGFAAAAGRSGAAAEVHCAGVPAGRLLSDRLPGARLAVAADWLGAWLVLRDQHAQLREAAFTDSLTGAWNRRYFDRFLDVALREARRDRHEVTLLVFDIDDFKRYNDAYGHSAGDEILIEATRLMRSVVRPSDRVCRIGGDEFAVVFNEPQGPREPGSQRPTSIMQIAERFQQQIATARFPKLGEAAPGPLTVSGGLASFPWDGHDVPTLLRIADERALASKRQGKNAITFGQ